MTGWQQAHPEIGDNLSDDEQRQVLDYIRAFPILSPWQEFELTGDGAISGVVIAGSGYSLFLKIRWLCWTPS